MTTDTLITEAEATEWIAKMAPRKVCRDCGIERPPIEYIGEDEFHEGCPVVELFGRRPVGVTFAFPSHGTVLKFLYTIQDLHARRESAAKGMQERAVAQVRESIAHVQRLHDQSAGGATADAWAVARWFLADAAKKIGELPLDGGTT